MKPTLTFWANHNCSGDPLEGSSREAFNFYRKAAVKSAVAVVSQRMGWLDEVCNGPAPSRVERPFPIALR